MKKIKRVTKSVNEEGLKPIFLSEVKYWKWRLSIEEMKHARTNSDKAGLEFKMKEMEIQKNQLQLLTLKEGYRLRTTEVHGKMSEYDSIKKEIEDDLGMSLNDCVIDDLTFEVKKLK